MLAKRIKFEEIRIQTQIRTESKKINQSEVLFVLSSIKTGSVLEKGRENKVQEGGNCDGNTESFKLN